MPNIEDAEFVRASVMEEALNPGEDCETVSTSFRFVRYWGRDQAIGMTYRPCRLKEFSDDEADVSGTPFSSVDAGLSVCGPRMRS